MNRPQDGETGSSLLEVIVAFAIIMFGVAAFGEALTGAYRAARRTKLQATTLAFAQSHIDTLGLDGPLTDGTTTGRYSQGQQWRLVVSSLATYEADRGAAQRPAYWIILDVADRKGAAVVRLQTAKVVPQPR
jgi:type II secretory pathway pseudopilin PulG